uniref:Uncharacterized protein n=1 Tax=Janibacter limosus TaxID=53458 RepID=A0AC61U262_9MICO|nr:hypothetical protein [Janibacter limosus]
MRTPGRTTLRRCAPRAHDLKEMRAPGAHVRRTTLRRCAPRGHDLKEMRLRLLGHGAPGGGLVAVIDLDVRAQLGGDLVERSAQLGEVDVLGDPRPRRSPRRAAHRSSGHR